MASATRTFVSAPRAAVDCCDIRRHLAEQFALAARLYAEAVVSLTIQFMPISSNEYNRLTEAAEEARRRAAATGIAFEEHVDSHGCGAGSDHGLVSRSRRFEVIMPLNQSS